MGFIGTDFGLAFAVGRFGFFEDVDEVFALGGNVRETHKCSLGFKTYCRDCFVRFVVNRDALAYKTWTSHFCGKEPWCWVGGFFDESVWDSGVLIWSSEPILVYEDGV